MIRKISSITELDCTLKLLSFDEWLYIPEPNFFSGAIESRSVFYPVLSKVDALKKWTSIVSLINVNGMLYKLDSADRKDAWLVGAAEKPSSIHALIFDMSKDEFDSLVNNANDIIFNALPSWEQVKIIYADLGLNMSSDRLRSGLIYEALSLALRGKQRNLQDKRSAREKEDINLRKAVEFFKEELLFLDQVTPKIDVFLTGVLAAALIMLALDKAGVKDFLIKLNDGQGETKNGKQDPIHNLLNIISKHRLNKRNNDPKLAIDLCQKSVQAMMLWCDGSDSSVFWRERDIKGCDLWPIIFEMKSNRKASDIKYL